MQDDTQLNARGCGEGIGLPAVLDVTGDDFMSKNRVLKKCFFEITQKLRIFIKASKKIKDASR